MKLRLPVNFETIEIFCDRVVLKPISMQYAEEIFKEFTDEITKLMIPKTPSQIEEVQSFIESSIKNMQDRVELILVILDKISHEFLGVCALHGQPDPRRPVLGIWLKKTAHGNKIGQEAISNLVNWARTNIVYEYFVYPCDESNIPSRKIAEKLQGIKFRTQEIKSLSGNILKEIAYKID